MSGKELQGHCLRGSQVTKDFPRNQDALVFKAMGKLVAFIFCFFLADLALSQTIYSRDKLTLLADSLHVEGFYQEALSLRKQAVDEGKQTSKAYQTYLEAKYYHTQSAYFENLSYDYYNPNAAISKNQKTTYLDSALIAAKKAQKTYASVKHPDKKFQYQIQNRIYHQTAYLGNWKEALAEAQWGYEILKDTLSENDKTFVDLIYDIGYIYSQLGDFSKAVENYQHSLNLYRKIVGENHTDIAQAYNNIAVEYRNLGLRQKELQSLLKAKQIWEKLNREEDKNFLYKCYGNLFYWYSYYGDFEKADEYLLKKRKLREDDFSITEFGFLRNKEEVYKDELLENHDLMVYYRQRKDTAKSMVYLSKTLKTLRGKSSLQDFEVKHLIAALKATGELEQTSNVEESISCLDKAIDLADKYQLQYYTNSFPLKLQKLKLLVEVTHDQFAFSELCSQLEPYMHAQNSDGQFQFWLLKAKNARFNNNEKAASKAYDLAFKTLLNAPEKPLDTIEFQDLKPLISFETVQGLLDMAEFHTILFSLHDEGKELDKAKVKLLLASKVYNELYLGNRYNDELYNVNKRLNTQLLECALLTPKDDLFLIRALNAVENGGAKLTWSRFIFNNQRQHLKIPNELLEKEDELKAQLNLYQKKVVNEPEVSEDKLLLWKEKIYQLKEDLSLLQDSIKIKNAAVFQWNAKEFSITEFQKSLLPNQAVLKYVMTEKKVFPILISNKTLKISKPLDAALLNVQLKSVLEILKHREPNYSEPLANLSHLLLDGTALNSFEKITIVPDGALYYLPFETLYLDKKMPDISYTSSLVLFQAQGYSNFSSRQVQIGAFATSPETSRLFHAHEELVSILAEFQGEAFYNATRQQFLNKANDFNVLHLAMHSEINGNSPEFSSLIFDGEDRKLFISELYNENLKASMVVLSACDTGNGFYENGEGVISISRAFTFAGVPSTVMSLWKVDDETTQIIMKAFYKHLKKGETKDLALKNAKLDYLESTKDPLLKHPYYWSGFVVAGNTQALVANHHYWWFLIVLPLVSLILFRKKLLQFFKK